MENSRTDVIGFYMDPGNSGKSSKLKLEISGLGKSWREALALENSGEVR